MKGVSLSLCSPEASGSDDVACGAPGGAAAVIKGSANTTVFARLTLSRRRAITYDYYTRLGVSGSGGEFQPNRQKGAEALR